MYASIRQYDGLDSMDEVVRRAEEGFVPIISEGRGFVAYYLIDAGDGKGATISIFEDQAAAEESNQAAAEWVKENLAPLVPNPPQITVGEVRVHKAG